MTDVSHTLHRSWDQPTSIAAAQAIVDRVSELQIEVLAYALKRGAAGFTDHQMQIDLGDYTSTLRTRRSELARMGKIVDSGRRMRPSGKRREFIVWIHKDFA